MSGGVPVKVVGPTHPWPFSFAVTTEGIYYPVPPHSGGLRFIRFHNFSTGQSRPVAVASHPFSLGMSVSPDGRYILFDQIEQSASDLMLVPDFQPQ